MELSSGDHKYTQHQKLNGERKHLKHLCASNKSPHCHYKDNHLSEFTQRRQFWVNVGCVPMHLNLNVQQTCGSSKQISVNSCCKVGSKWKRKKHKDLIQWCRWARGKVHPGQMTSLFRAWRKETNRDWQFKATN